MNELRLFFLRQRSTCRGQKGKVQRAMQTVLLALAGVLAVAYFLSENLHGSTIASFAFALLMCLIAAIALWSSETNEDVLYDRYCKAQRIEAIETFCEAEKKMLINDDSGWHTLEMKPAATVQTAVTRDPEREDAAPSRRMGMRDVLAIAVMSAIGLALTVMLTRTGPELEMTLKKPLVPETRQPPTKAPPEAIQIGGLSE